MSSSESEDRTDGSLGRVGPQSNEKGSGEKNEDDGWREYNWKEVSAGRWECDLMKCFLFEFQGEKGAELQLSDRRYRDVDLAAVQTRLLQSVLQHATVLEAGEQLEVEIIDVVARVLQNSDNPAPVLEDLSFAECDIERLRPFLDAIAARKLIELKCLSLDFLYQEDLAPKGSLPCGKYLASVIGSDNLPNLAEFSVAGSPWNPSGFRLASNEFKSLVASLKDIGGSLRNLDLSYIDIEREGHLALAEVLESGHLLHLEKLTLRDTGMNSAASVAYCKGLVRLEALEELDFSFNTEMEKRGHVALAKAVKAGHLPQLKKLKLSKTGMNSAACVAYCKGLVSLEALEELDFSDNPILEEKGHVALAAAMESGHLPRLESLNLADTYMIEAYCKAYAKAFLSGNAPALKMIQFGNNEIGDEGAKALSLALASGHLDKLVSIDLKSNNITDAGIEAICKIAMIEGHLRRLRELDLSENQMSKIGFSFIGSAIASGGLNSLFCLTLEKCTTSEDEDFLSILAAVSETKSFIAHIKGGGGDMTRQLEQLRDRNWKHVLMMIELAGRVVSAKHGKIYLCGNPEAGKTTLRRTLSRSLWKSLCMWERRPHIEERTRGIAVSELKSEGKDGVSLALWDMAGQREYHMVHHSFLRDLASLDAKATIFIIVCKSQEDITKVEDELEYWLQFIASSCRKETQTPRGVFVVLNRNHGDSRILEQSQINDWKVHLSNMKQKFKGYLNIYTEMQNLFVMDVRRRKSVQSLKKSLLQHSKQMLENTNVPEICHQIQVQVNVWKRTMPFPVLHWTEFLKKLQEINPQWKEKTVEAATRCLNEEGAVVYINKEFPPDWQIPHAQLVILDPNWLCAEVVGNIFLPENLKKLRSRELKVNRYNGAVSIGELKDFFKVTKNFEWEDSDLQDVMSMLLWLGLCYRDRAGNFFIPSRIIEDTSRGESWDGLSISLKDLHSVDQWVMGFSVEYQKSEIGLAPIALWHNFQVELAQTSEYNGGGLGNDFTVGKYFVGFKCKQMAVLIEVNVSNDNPTFRSIDLFVKPIDDQAKTTKEGQVDLAHQLVQSLCELWGEVCPGIGHVRKVVWPWPVSQPKPNFTDAKLEELCWEVSRIKGMVKDNGMGKLAEARVGATGKIAFEQLLCKQDIEDVVRSLKGELQEKVQAWNSEMEEGIKLGVFPDDVLKRKVSMQGSKAEASTSRGLIVRENFKPIEADQLKSMTPTDQETFRYLEYQRRLAEQILAVAQQSQDIALDNQRMIREVYKELNQVKTQQELTLEKLQNFEQLFLENAEHSCPRFIYLVTKSSGSSVVATLKNAMSRISPTVKFHIRFLCEAPYDAGGNHGQHALADDLQEGIDVSILEDWARKLAPWLKVSLAVLSISAKVAANVFAPGLGSIIPNLSDIVPATVAELIVAGTGHAMSSLDSLMHEGQEPSSASSPSNPQELSGNSRKEMTEKLQGLSAKEFERKIGLSKVCLKQVGGSSSPVLWICSTCKREYCESNKISRIFEL